MNGTQKIDVLDLIIEVLRNHEKTLDAQITRLERVIDRIRIEDPSEDLSRRFHEPL